MNRYLFISIFLLIFANGCKQKDTETEEAVSGNSLLWRISGNGLEKPSYLYGTVHMICGEYAVLSDIFKKIIRNTDEVYFEVDLDDMEEMMAAMDNMKMKGDTTLEDLLSASDYEKVKDYIEEHSTILPFSEIKKYLPILACSVLLDELMTCEEKTGIEEVITEVAEKHKKPTRGIETLEFQLSLMDSIPYAAQAQDLVAFIDSAVDKERMQFHIDRFFNAYNEQDLAELEQITYEMDSSIIKYDELLLYNRNKNWITKLKKLLAEGSLVLAVGAAHLPGEKGVINLLRKEGYEVTAIKNDLPLKKKKN